MSVPHARRPQETKTYAAWKRHAEGLKKRRLKSLFDRDNHRFDRFCLGLKDESFLLDLSKHFLVPESLSIWQAFAEEMGLSTAKRDFEKGSFLNTTEDRTVLHFLCRQPLSTQPPAWQEARRQVFLLAQALRAGHKKGYSQQSITDLVHIGIGGSHLGPRMASEALKPLGSCPLRVHYLARPGETQALLSKLSAEKTLFVLASKSFATTEMLSCAESVRRWFLDKATEADMKKHVYAISADKEKAKAWGVEGSQIFWMPWEVNGRFSLWSAMGLPTVCELGEAVFEELLQGAQDMDEHFFNAPFAQNLPTLLACLSFQYLHFWHFNHQALLIYHARLKALIPYLQQLVMESHGKSVDKAGRSVSYATHPVVFGGIGTDVQHSFMQALHQGPTPIPCEVILFAKDEQGLKQNFLLAHGLAQTQALLEGKTFARAPHRSCPGNRPSTTFLIDQLSAHSLGMLLACYEHRIFVEGVLQHVHSFDQWGVELGKNLAQNTLTDSKATNSTSTATQKWGKSLLRESLMKIGLVQP